MQLKLVFLASIGIIGLLLTQRVESDVGDEQLKQFFNNQVNLFHTQARLGEKERQFAVVTLGSSQNRGDGVYVNPFESSFGYYIFSNNRLQQQSGVQLTNSQASIYPSTAVAFNFLVARPDGSRTNTKTMVHSETQLLQHLPAMWDRFSRKLITPDVITLFSWLMPCTEHAQLSNRGCRQRIVDKFNEPKYSRAQKVLAYGKGSSDQDTNEFRRLLSQNNIRVLFLSGTHPANVNSTGSRSMSNYLGTSGNWGHHGHQSRFGRPCSPTHPCGPSDQTGYGRNETAHWTTTSRPRGRILLDSNGASTTPTASRIRGGAFVTTTTTRPRLQDRIVAGTTTATSIGSRAKNLMGRMFGGRRTGDEVGQSGRTRAGSAGQLVGGTTNTPRNRANSYPG